MPSYCACLGQRARKGACDPRTTVGRLDPIQKATAERLGGGAHGRDGHCLRNGGDKEGPRSPERLHTLLEGNFGNLSALLNI